MIFGRCYTLTLNRIQDRVRVVNGKESLMLTVSLDPMQIVSGLTKAQDKLSALTKDGKTPEPEEMQDVAEYFASVIFGPEQAAKLMAFYDDNAENVVNICGAYFKDRLARKITEAQKGLARRK